MALYPTLSESPYLTIDIGMTQKILKSNFDDLGVIQTKRKWLYPRRSIQLTYNNINNTQLKELRQFYIDRNAGYSAFTFIMPSGESETFESEYISTGDGSTTNFNLPCKGGSSFSVYLDGVIQSQGGDYYITENNGADGVDLLTFVVAPTNGVRITVDFTGRLAIRCRFSENGLIYNRVKYSNSFNTLTIQLDGDLMDVT